MAAAAQPLGDALPTPAAVPRTVNQHEGGSHGIPPTIFAAAHGCQAASASLGTSAPCRALSITLNKARNTSGTPSPLTAETTSGVFLAARLSSAGCCLISSGLCASDLLSATIS